MRRSAVWGALIWGTEGPEFKSRQPDNKNREPGGVVGSIDADLEALISDPDQTCDNPVAGFEEPAARFARNVVEFGD